MKTLIVAFTAWLFACVVHAGDQPMIALIPAPAKLQPQPGVFVLRPDTPIVADPALATAQQLAERVLGTRGTTGQPAIVLTTKGAKPELGAEGYELTVLPTGIVIRAPQPAGAFYGVQTLRQLLPVDKTAECQIPCVHIEDQPRFAWRGMMLDTSRHFFNKAEVKQLLDALALHKINTFHWHLTDDQGWRIEIKKHPKLTQIGAWRKDIGFGLDPKSSTAYGPDGRYGGFYTQDDIREVVAYAAARHITIVPEIEMPGHAAAALAAYPQFSCAGSGYSTDFGAGVHAGVYCAGRDEAFGFVQDVLAEVIELFPSQFIHIGGDEVPKGNWKKCAKCQARIKAEGLKNEHELQSYFIRRVEKFINSKDRRLIGWSEIREGGLAQNAALMDWIGGAVEGASAGHDVVMSPTSHCYFDYYQSQDHSTEPKSIGGYLPLAKVYAFEPIPAKLAPEFRKHILGAQGNIWTEYIPSLKQVEYMAFPRLTALAEVTWSPATLRNWDDFNRRLAVHTKRLDALGIRCRRDTSVPIGDWKPAQLQPGGSTLEWDATKAITGAGDYRVSLSWTKGAHGVDIAWVALIEDGKEISRDAHAGFTGGKPKQPIYTVNLPNWSTHGRYTIQAHVAGNGGTDSHGVVALTLQEKK